MILVKILKKAELFNYFIYLGDGRGLASGFYQAIVLGEGGPTLNINNTFCCFYQNYNLVEFLSCYLSNDIRKHGQSFT